MIRIVSGLCIALVLMTGCGGTDTTPPESSADAAATTTTEASSIGVVAVEVAPCDLVTTEEVAAATGLNVASATDVPPLMCLFDFGDDAGVDVFISADDAKGRMSGPAALLEEYRSFMAAGEAEAISGLGAAAVYAPGFRTLAVSLGDGRFIAIGVNGGFNALTEPRAALEAIARAAIGRL